MPRVLSLDKSLSLLEAVFQSKEGIGTHSLQRQLGYNVATVHNIAMTFCKRGYLRQDPQTRHFSPGIRMMLMARHPGYIQSLTSSASAIVEEISEKLNESVLLASISHGRMLNLKYVPSKQALRVHEPEDMSDHSYCTAFGKVLLSTLNETEIDTYLKETRLERFTPNTICTEEGLRGELQMVRKKGYAKTRDEYCEGVSALAVPIHDPWGNVIASIGASAPSVRLQKAQQFKESLQELQNAAAAIGHICGEEIKEEGAKKEKRKKRVP